MAPKILKALALATGIFYLSTVICNCSNYIRERGVADVAVRDPDISPELRAQWIFYRGHDLRARYLFDPRLAFKDHENRRPLRLQPLLMDSEGELTPLADSYSPDTEKGERIVFRLEGVEYHPHFDASKVELSLDGEDLIPGRDFSIDRVDRSRFENL